MARLDLNQFTRKEPGKLAREKSIEEAAIQYGPWYLLHIVTAFYIFFVEAVVFARGWFVFCAFFPIALWTNRAVRQKRSGTNEPVNYLARGIFSGFFMIFALLWLFFEFASFRFDELELLAPLIYSWLIPLMVMGFFSRSAAGRTPRERARIGYLYLATILATFAFCIISNDVGLKRSSRLIAAVEKYHADNGHYPASLQDLVPKYVKTVPPINLSLNSPDFSYSTSKTVGATLGHNYGWERWCIYYDFKTKKWREFYNEY
jgi:hypothetical protein